MSLSVRVHGKVWLEHNDEMVLGSGRAELLRRIAVMGSLKKAAESLGMSYRAAWGRIKRTEAAMGMALVEDAGARRDGYRLTPQGKEVVEAFIRWQEDVRRYAEQHAADLPFVRVEAADQDAARQVSSDA